MCVDTGSATAGGSSTVRRISNEPRSQAWVTLWRDQSGRSTSWQHNCHSLRLAALILLADNDLAGPRGLRQTIAHADDPGGPQTPVPTGSGPVLDRSGTFRKPSQPRPTDRNLRPWAGPTRFLYGNLPSFPARRLIG
jgi:hypothetical protein